MCCWFASSFGWFSVLWGSTCLRASTTIVSIRHQRNTFLSTWSTTRPNVRPSLAKTSLRSGGRTSRSTLTMWALATLPCCKWWECHSSSFLKLHFLFHTNLFSHFPMSFGFLFLLCFTWRPVIASHLIYFHNTLRLHIGPSHMLICVCFSMHFSSLTGFFPYTSCTTGHASLSVWIWILFGVILGFAWYYLLFVSASVFSHVSF